MDLSPTTLRTYRAQIERTIRPALGSIKRRTASGRRTSTTYIERS